MPIIQKRKVKRSRKIDESTVSFTSGMSPHQEKRRTRCAAQIKELAWARYLAKFCSGLNPDHVDIVTLDIMRYGNRGLYGGWWFLAYESCEVCECEKDEQDECDPECAFDEAPKLDDYEPNEHGVQGYVIARGKWAVDAMREEFLDACETMKELSTKTRFTT